MDARSGEGDDLQREHGIAGTQQELRRARIEQRDARLSGEAWLELQLVKRSKSRARELRNDADACDVTGREHDALARPEVADWPAFSRSGPAVFGRRTTSAWLPPNVSSIDTARRRFFSKGATPIAPCSIACRI
jgi:hypothetical protein